MRQIAFRMTAAAVLAGLAVLIASTQPQAQSWPQRPVRLIVPFGPGAGADIGARLLSERLPSRWGGKPIVIENRPGGDGLLAIQSFLSANDDHTFLFTPAGNFTVHPF
jgi:tripartite-type tricarboxylate transporter receptor subunit TctC